MITLMYVEKRRFFFNFFMEKSFIFFGVVLLLTLSQACTPWQYHNDYGYSQHQGTVYVPPVYVPRCPTGWSYEERRDEFEERCGRERVGTFLRSLLRQQQCQHPLFRCPQETSQETYKKM